MKALFKSLSAPGDFVPSETLLCNKDSLHIHVGVKYIEITEYIQQFNYI